MAEAITGSVYELGNAINLSNQKAMADMIALAMAAGGQITVGISDTILNVSVTTTHNTLTGKDEIDQVWIDNVKVMEDGEIQAGGLVQLQFKIDQMMAAVQEGIKNSGKVSQTREGAARA